MPEFRMPALGADMEAGTLVAWRRKPGERLARGDVIAEVETDKGVIEVEVFEPGVLSRYLVEPGTRVPVGTPLAVLSAVSEDEGRAPSQVVKPEVATSAGPAVAASTASSVRRDEAKPAPVSAARVEVPEIPLPPSLRRRARELGVAPGTLLARALHLEPAGFASDEPAAPASDAPTTLASDAPTTLASDAPAPPTEATRPRSSPAARVRARELGIALAAVSGTGPGGAVVLADVERQVARQSLAQNEPTQTIPRAPEPGASLGPQARLRRAIAAAMARSKREIPHYYLSTTIDFGRAANWLAERNLRTSVQQRMLPAVLLLKAVARAARKLPDFNALWREGQLERPKDVNLGVAIALRGGGLIAPAIHQADNLELPELMQKLSDLVQRARAGTLRSSELSEGTLTVTSLGERGVDAVFPIIYAPQTAIVGFGKIADRPWVVDDAVRVRPLVTASLAADHRVTDGHLGARFLNLIDSLLQEPEKL